MTDGSVERLPIHPMTIGPAHLSVVSLPPGESGPFTLSIRFPERDYRTPVPTGDIRDVLGLLQQAGEAFADRMFRLRWPIPGPVEAMLPPPIPQFAYVEGEAIREAIEKLAGHS